MERYTHIRVIPSDELHNMRLDGLIRQEGLVVEIKKNKLGRVYGCWVLFSEPIYDYQEWFIPILSIYEIF